MIDVRRANDQEDDMSETDERVTMVHTLREEPGSYPRALEHGAEITCGVVCPSDSEFGAEWEYVATSGFMEEAKRSRREAFTSHADARRYLEENLDEPLTYGGP
jgi:hypothetical protein